jgi:predicted nuclease of predicted toxin-antitoxin system
MKFLVDAHFPRRLAEQLRNVGYDTLHTSDLPLGNRTPDRVINEISIRQQRVVITKDAEFVNSFMVAQRPYKLLLVSTGNISNRELERLFQQNLAAIVAGFATHDFIELNRTRLTFHI